MKFKRLFLILIGSVFCLSSTCNDIAKTNKINGLKENISSLVTRLNKSEDFVNESPEDIFENAIENYKTEFDDYIDITALNVEDKEEVMLPNFNANYVAPKFYDVMNEYQINLERSLSRIQRIKYNELQKNLYTFDRYVVLNENKYTNLNPILKYSHLNIPLNPMNPITPVNPDISIMENNNIEDRLIVTSGIVAILSGVGLSEAAIAGFTGAISTLTTAISTSWIPFVGWVLAVALAVGALIALTVIIVENWDKICQVIEEIKNWFLAQFKAFSSLIESYFNDATEKGKNSKVAGRERIGEIDVTRIAKTIKTVRDLAFLDLLKELDKVAFIMRNVKKKFDPETGKYYTSFWIFEELVTYKYITENNVYDRGVSTYTWRYLKAIRLLRNGTVLIKNQTTVGSDREYIVDVHLFSETETQTINGFDHLHIFQKIGIDENKKPVYIKIKKGPQAKVHSFYGPMYFKLPDGSLSTYPEKK